MLETIEIRIDGYKFTIRYPNGVDDYKFYKDLGEVSFYFEFMPASVMHSDVSDKILSVHFPQLRAEIVKVLRENTPRIFDLFEINLNYQECGSSSGYNDFGQQAAMESHIVMKWKLRNSLFTSNNYDRL